MMRAFIAGDPANNQGYQFLWPKITLIVESVPSKYSLASPPR
jgi:hypothetical protein